MRSYLVIGGAMALVTAFAPAQARRTAIDQNPNGTPLYYTLGGYCDLNGDDCGGTALNYTVKLGSGDPVNQIVLHGNGLLTFGSAIDFSGPPDSDTSFSQRIYNYESIAPELYGLNLVSVGQNNEVDFQSYGAFMQSARLSLGANGKITAEWFTCYAPTSPSTCPASSQQFLTLTPGKFGYNAVFSGVDTGASDRGYVIDGVFTPAGYGTSFLIPAQFTGLDLTSGVPEPASWALLIAGFGLTGAAMRRRRKVTAPQ